jgi:hypothetical protein
MQWIIDNWLLLALGGGMIAMHLFGHGHGKGGHGGTGGHSSRGDGGCCGGKEGRKAEEEAEIAASPIPKTGRSGPADRPENS